jgi:hypothetical protein
MLDYYFGSKNFLKGIQNFVTCANASVEMGLLLDPFLDGLEVSIASDRIFVEFVPCDLLQRLVTQFANFVHFFFTKI